MSQRIPCGNCGGKIALPVGHAKAKIRCNHCGYYAEVPEALRAAPSDPATAAAPLPVAAPRLRPTVVPDRDDDEDEGEELPAARSAPPASPRSRPRVDPRDTRPEFLVEDGTGVPLLEGTQDEDDDKPYAVPGTGLKPCPHCQVELPLDAVLCVHCGQRLDGKRKGKPKRTYQPLAGGWHEGWTWETRVGIVIGLQVANVVFVALAILFNGQRLTDGTAWFNHLSINIFNVFLQIFLVGTYDGFSLERTEKGKATLVKHRRLGFAKMAPAKVQWKQSTGTGVLATHDPGFVAWIVVAYLALYGLTPAAMFLFSVEITGFKLLVAGLLLVLGMGLPFGFYWMVIRPERFSVALADEYRCLQEKLFTSKSREQATEITKMVADATGLRYHEVL